MGSIAQTRELIKRRFNAHRRGEVESSIELEKHFKPIAEPLKAILEKGSLAPPLKKVKKEIKKEEPSSPKKKEEDSEDETDDESFQSINEGEVTNEEESMTSPPPTPSGKHGEAREYVKRFGPVTRPYMLKCITGGKEMDHTYGVRAGEADGQWMMGNKEISFDYQDGIYIDGKQVATASPGLMELLFMRSPREYTTVDEKTYISMLEETSAHKRSYDPEGFTQFTKYPKYKRIIHKHFVKKNKRNERKKRAKPGGSLKKTHGKRVFLPLESKRTYIYWNSIDELVKRLFLLHASQGAGNTGLDREILSIEEELREEGIIR